MKRNKKNTTSAQKTQAQATQTQQAQASTAANQAQQATTSTPIDDIINELISKRDEFVQLFDTPEFVEIADKNVDEIYDTIVGDSKEKIEKFSPSELERLSKAFTNLESYSLPKLSPEKRKIARTIFEAIDDCIVIAQNQATATPQQSQAQQTQQAQAQISLIDIGREIVDKKEKISSTINTVAESLSAKLEISASTDAETVQNIGMILNYVVEETLGDKLKSLEDLYRSSSSGEKKRFEKCVDALLKFCLAKAKSNFARTAIPMIFDNVYNIIDEVPGFEIPKELKGFEQFADYANIWSLAGQGKMSEALTEFAAIIVREGEEDASNNLTWTMRKIGVPVEKREAFFQEVEKKNIIKSHKRLTTINAAIGLEKRNGRFLKTAI